jgi:hypothetical protein
MPSLDSVTFDASGLTLQGDQDGVRVWHTPAGDGLGLYYFPIPPDIEPDLQSVSAVRGFYRAAAAQAGAAIIEVDVLQTNGCSGVRQIIKVPQQPHGMTYLGSLTLPFRDFSYVLKIQCMEQGTTGVRDAVVLDEKLAAGEVAIDEKKRTLRGWMQDPYDSSIRDVFARNQAEAEEYDERFPEHPLSRLRGLMRRVQETLRISENVRVQPPFEFARQQKSKKPWWKIW